MNSAIEDIYPLTPMRQGMLFHTLMAPYSGVYVEQLTCRIVATMARYVDEIRLLKEMSATASSLPDESTSIRI